MRSIGSRPTYIVETSTEGVSGEDEPKSEQDQPVPQESKSDEACGEREVLLYYSISIAINCTLRSIIRTWRHMAQHMNTVRVISREQWVLVQQTNAFCSRRCFVGSMDSVLSLLVNENTPPTENSNTPTEYVLACYLTVLLSAIDHDNQQIFPALF